MGRKIAPEAALAEVEWRGIKYFRGRTFLVVHWLRQQVSSAGTVRLILGMVRELRSHMPDGVANDK